MEQKVSPSVLSAFNCAVIKMGYSVQESRHEGGLGMVYKSDNLMLGVSENGYTKEQHSVFENEVQLLVKLLNSLKEAHHVYENGQPLPFESIKDYRLVSEYGDVMLAAKMSMDSEVHFTTWEYDYDHKGVIAGHYYDTNYNGAKQDFAIRAGLIDKDKLFEKEELSAIYEACVFRGRNDEDITYDSEKLLREVMDKVEENLPTQNIQEQEQELER